MQITVDDDVFHKWAMDRGYVRLTDISDFANRKFSSVIVDEIHPPNGEPPVVYVKEFNDNFIDQKPKDKFEFSARGMLDALENPEVLKPEPTDQELTNALTSVLQLKGKGAAMQLLADFDTTSVKRIPEGRAREFLAAAEKAVAS